MNKAQRAELLRQRFKAKGGIAYPCDPRRSVKPKWVEHSGPLMFSRAYPFGVARFDTHCRWVHEPNPKPKVSPRTKRNAGIATLAKVAMKAQPQKLVRSRDADQLLAERARR